MRLLLSVLIRVKAAAWRFNQLDNCVLPRKALYWCYLVSRETLQAYYAPLQKLKIKQKSKLMPRSEINFVVRARGAVFKVRGPVTTSFGLGRGVEWGRGGGQILLFSLCVCLELSDCWTFLQSLSSGVMFINFKRLKTPVIVEYKAIWQKKLRYKLTNLVLTKIFCQSLGPSLYRGCTVLNCIYLLFKKWGVPGPPSPSPCAGPV